MLSLIIVVLVFAFLDPSRLDLLLDVSSTIISSFEPDLSLLMGAIKECHSFVLNN